MRTRLPLLLVFLFLLAAGALRPAPACGQQTFTYAATPLRTVILDLQARTDYRFLYRDALVADTRLTLRTDTEGLWTALTEALAREGLQLQVDEARRQVLLAEAPTAAPAAQPTALTGQVLDDEDGARLPFATLTWYEEGQLRGVSANAAGWFRLPLHLLHTRPTFDVTISYLGYRPRQVRLHREALPTNLSVRLTPAPLAGHEVLIHAAALQTDLDTTWHALLRPGLHATFGEGSVMRSLEALPAVGLTTGLSGGLNVRGSRSDGFQVLLDGAPIYNQHHLFGLFDAFNADALQTVGFFYDIAPATVQGPPGGTLAFATRTGSQTAPKARVGVSNTAYRATAEGPLLDGRASWLVSGRRAYLGAIDWFGNAALVAQGLNLDRDTDAPDLPGTRAEAFTTTDAAFYDLHTKLYYEAPRGARLMLNGYLGGDDTRINAVRILPPSDTQARPVPVPIGTANRWGNAALSLQYQQPLGRQHYARSVLAFTRYHGDYEKDDFFIYRTDTDRTTPGGTPPVQEPPDLSRELVLGTFTNANRLVEWQLSQQVDFAGRAASTWSFGYAAHRYDIQYDETSPQRRAFDLQRASVLFDAFGQYEGRPVDGLHLRAGLRTHSFTEGSYVRLSPRIYARFRPDARLSVGLGLSRNHQFIHRLSLAQDAITDVWVMSTAAQGPGRVDQLSGGMYVRLPRQMYLQAEGYVKDFTGLRQHETFAALRAIAEGVFRVTPWVHDVTGAARGLELMLRVPLGPAQTTLTYTRSRMQLQHPDLNDGRAFAADWDRPHQFTASMEAGLTRALTLSATWRAASGTPNPLAGLLADEPDRLSAYHRLDATLAYRYDLGTSHLEARLSAFNLYNHANPWYRTLVPIVDAERSVTDPVEVRVVSAYVYDLGLQPAFSLALTF